MDKKILFYGTPLSKALQDEKPDEDVTNRNRRAFRLDKQQTVRDEQGRQRFHGAFTGGFSAGYFNTVDSVSGFKPQNFVTHRGDRRGKEFSTKFQHRPEDYMDDEDFSEFGIAPKKIRVTNEYKKAGVELNNIRQTSLSIGERILNQISANTNSYHRINIQCTSYPVKNDYHGLGYKPLKKRDESIGHINPLIATLDKGRCIKISGEAFGSGVLDEDEDLFEHEHAYGYDNAIKFNTDIKKSETPTRSTKTLLSNLNKYTNLEGFIESENQLVDQSSELLNKKYPQPCVPDDWIMPSRVVPSQTNTTLSDDDLVLKKCQSSSILNKKFTDVAGSLDLDIIGGRGGLVSCSELKSAKKFEKDLPAPVVEDEICKAVIFSEKVEWHPCSLLCKHFNVPNPFPGSKISGLPHTKQIGDNNLIDQDSTIESFQALAPLDLRRSIFNVSFSTPSKVTFSDEIAIDSEDEPQVVEVKSSDSSGPVDQSSDEDQITVIPPAELKPELIVLSSSSSDTDDGKDEPSGVSKEVGEEDDVDTYGPPLPPSLETLINLSGRQVESRKHSSSERKRLKRHKRRRQKD